MLTLDSRVKGNWRRGYGGEQRIKVWSNHGGNRCLRDARSRAFRDELAKNLSSQSRALWCRAWHCASRLLNGSHRQDSSWSQATFRGYPQHVFEQTSFATFKTLWTLYSASTRFCGRFSLSDNWILSPRSSFLCRSFGSWSWFVSRGDCWQVHWISGFLAALYKILTVCPCWWLCDKVFGTVSGGTKHLCHLEYTQERTPHPALGIQTWQGKCGFELRSSHFSWIFTQSGGVHERSKFYELCTPSPYFSE